MKIKGKVDLAKEFCPECILRFSRFTRLYFFVYHNGAPSYLLYLHIKTMGNQQMQQVGAVAGDPAHAEKELRRRILQNRNEVKLAIIGERNSGKSSLINTVYRVLTEDAYGFVAEKGNFNSMKQTTNFYREHKLPANITVFDSVGANYSKQGELRGLYYYFS